MSELTVISLGWGVQSFTLCAMSALGDLPPVDFAIHADTTWERSATYEFAARWALWLEEHGVKVVTVSDASQAAKVTTFATDIPAFADHVKVVDSFGGVMIPAATTISIGENGKLRRQCTNRWKIEPMHRYIKAQGATAKQPCEQWIGISKDEWHRAKDSDVRYIVHRFPLLDLGMTRADCIAWLTVHGLEVPGKSSCTFCPFHNAVAWQEMKRKDGPDWKQAVEIDAAIRDKRPPYPLFVHRSCKPLSEAVVISEDFGWTQLDMMSDIDNADASCDGGACFL